MYWGLADLTDVAIQKYNGGDRNFLATNEYWGKDGWPTYTKSLVIVYDICGHYTSVVVREGQTATLPWWM